MEQFNIEKLKRITPYELPENTFEEVQKNVLAQTIKTKQTPVFKMQWVYAAAAVFVLLIGFGFLINSGSEKNIVDKSSIASTDSIVRQTENNEMAFMETSQNDNTEEDFAASSQNIAAADLTSGPVAHLNTKEPKLKTASFVSVRNAKATTVPLDQQVDNVLDGFSASEIASISTNAEQDVYLDLYN